MSLNTQEIPNCCAQHTAMPGFVFCLLQIRRQAIKELPRFAAGENLPRVADILTQLLQTGICKN